MFADPIVLGDEGIVGGMAATSSESSGPYVRVLTDLGSLAFGTPALLKRKLDTIAPTGPPLPSQPSPPQPVPKRLRRDCDRDIGDQMRTLIRTLGPYDWMPCTVPS